MIRCQLPPVIGSLHCVSLLYLYRQSNENPMNISSKNQFLHVFSSICIENPTKLTPATAHFWGFSPCFARRKWQATAPSLCESSKLYMKHIKKHGGCQNSYFPYIYICIIYIGTFTHSWVIASVDVGTYSSIIK